MDRVKPKRARVGRLREEDAATGECARVHGNTTSTQWGVSEQQTIQDLETKSKKCEHFKMITVARIR